MHDLLIVTLFDQNKTMIHPDATQKVLEVFAETAIVAVRLLACVPLFYKFSEVAQIEIQCVVA